MAKPLMTPEAIAIRERLAGTRTDGRLKYPMPVCDCFWCGAEIKGAETRTIMQSWGGLHDGRYWRRLKCASCLRYFLAGVPGDSYQTTDRYTADVTTRKGVISEAEILAARPPSPPIDWGPVRALDLNAPPPELDYEGNPIRYSEDGIPLLPDSMQDEWQGPAPIEPGLSPKAGAAAEMPTSSPTVQFPRPTLPEPSFQYDYDWDPDP